MGIDKLEKFGRLVLWLTLAAACVIIPIEYGKHQAASALLRAEEKRAEEKRVAELAKAKETSGPQRLTLASMGDAFRALDMPSATARVFFSNVSPRTGVVCIRGVATNPTTQQAAESLASCQSVGAYETTVVMKVQFAGGDLSDVCHNVTCKLTIKEAPGPQELGPTAAR